MKSFFAQFKPEGEHQNLFYVHYTLSRGGSQANFAEETKFFAGEGRQGSAAGAAVKT